MIRQIALLAAIVALGAFVALGLYRRITRPEPPQAQSVQAQKKPFGPCEDHRRGLAQAPAVPGLDPRALALSSDCRWIVSGNLNGSVQVLDSETGKVRSEVPGFGTPVRHLLISSDDKYVFASAQADENVHAWSLPNMAPVATVRARGAALAFDSRASLLFTGGSSELSAWKLEPMPGGAVASPSAAFTVRARGVVESLALSPDAQYLAAGETGSIEVWKVESGERPGLTSVAAVSPYELKNWVTGIAFSVDGKALATANRNHEIAVWQVPSLEPVPQAAANPPRWSMYEDPWKFTVRPPRDYTGADKQQLVIRLHDSTADRVYVASENLKPGELRAQRGLIQVNANSGGISVFDIFEPSMDRTVAIPTSPAGMIAMLNFAPLRGGSWLAMKRRDAAISVIDVNTLKEVKRVAAPPARAHLQGTLNGRHLAYSTGGEIGFVDLDTWEIRKLPRPKMGADEQLINLGLAASLDGVGVAAIFDDKLVEVRPDLSVKEVAPLPIMGVEFMAPLKGKRAYLLSGTAGTKAFGNPVITVNPLAQASPMGGVAFAADEWALYVAEIQRSRICRYPLEGRNPCEVVTVFEGPEPPIDIGGKLLALGVRKQVRVVDGSSGKEIASFDGHLGEVSFVQVLGDRVLSVDKLGEVRVWKPGNASPLLSAKLY